MKPIVARMKKLYNWKISPEMVIATPGIVKGFYTAARAICSPGDGLLMQPPVYFPFLKTHEQAGLVRQLAPLTARSRKGRIDYEIDFDVFNAAFDSENAKTRMFLFCNPHNPTGTAYSRKQLTRMAEDLPGTQCSHLLGRDPQRNSAWQGAAYTDCEALA